MSGIPARKLEVAVIGAGQIGLRHAAIVQASKVATLVGIVEPTPAAAAKAQELGVAVWSTIDQMEGVEAVIIATPSTTHAELASQLLAASIHVLVEKPIAVDAASARQLLDVGDVSSAKLLVGHQRRFNPYYVRARQAVQSGSLGSVVAFSSVWACKKGDSYFDVPWRRKAGSGGVLLTNVRLPPVNAQY